MSVLHRNLLMFECIFTRASLIVLVCVFAAFCVLVVLIWLLVAVHETGWSVKLSVMC